MCLSCLGEIIWKLTIKKKQIKINLLFISGDKGLLHLSTKCISTYILMLQNSCFILCGEIPKNIINLLSLHFRDDGLNQHRLNKKDIKEFWKSIYKMLLPLQICSLTYEIVWKLSYCVFVSMCAHIKVHTLFWGLSMYFSAQWTPRPPPKKKNYPGGEKYIYLF